MTDKEVQRLGRRELLEFLLEAREENDSLLRERDSLLKERDTLRSNLVKLQEDLKNAKASPDDVSDKATALLMEARAAADDVLESRRQQQLAKEQHLQEWERCLTERARQLDDLQHRLNEQRDSLDELSEKLLSEAHNASMQLRKQAEEESSEILRSARSAAAQTEKEAVDQAALLIQRAQEDSSSFWQDVSSLLQKKLDAMEDG